MKDTLYLFGFLLVAGILLFLGRGRLQGSVLVAWLLTLGGTTVVAVLLATLYRFRLALRASRLEVARQEAELSFARKVQKALFPRKFPRGEGLEFSAVCIPAKGISGDYYDVIRLDDGRLVFAIADVSGKGISAAILMANLQALLRVVAATHPSPSEVCKQLNSHLLQVSEGYRFITLFYADWEPATRRLQYVNAGHNPPIFLDSSGLHYLRKGGIPLGILPASSFEMGEIFLNPQDLLVLYSDGITEAEQSDGLEFGEDRLSRLVFNHRNEQLPELRSFILDAVKKRPRGAPADDMTLVLVRGTEFEPDIARAPSQTSTGAL